MKRTPLYEEHLRLGAKMVEFGGWEMPLNFPQGILAEHLATRKYGGLFDISHMGRFHIAGEDALPFLQYVLTNNAGALLVGESQYTIIPNENGGAIDDTYLYRMGEKKYLLVVNAANTERDWNYLQNYRSKFPRLTLEDHTAKRAMLSLQGPKTKEVLKGVLGEKGRLPEPARNKLVNTEILGGEVPIARTGYTGEPIGFELFPPAEIAVPLYKMLLEAGEDAGIVPVGLGARDTLRLEAGLPLYGHELGTDALGKEIPVFALPAAKIAVSFSKVKGEFIGRGKLLKQFEETKLRQEEHLDKPKEAYLVPRTMTKLAISGGVARAGYPIYIDKELAGHVTSGTAVPYWEIEGAGITSQLGTKSKTRAIVTAYLDADLKEGQKVSIDVRGRALEGVVVKRHLSAQAPPYTRPIFVPEETKENSANCEGSMKDLAINLVKKASGNTLWRQKRAINLIPSENTMSPLVRLLSIADPSGRYAEHRKVEALGNIEAYYYQGTGFIAGVETELIEKMKSYIGCSEVEVRLISGQMANATVFSALVDYFNRADRRAEPRRMRSVMNHNLGRGGHLSAQPMGALRDYVAKDPVTEKWAVVNFPVLPDNPYQVDLTKTEELIEEYKPELIIFGKSMMLYPEPVREMAKIVAAIKPKPIILYDSAHVFGLLGAYFQEPLKEGADILTASTHKTFFGTQRGIVASNMSYGTGYGELWQAVVRRAFPGSVSNHHLGTLLGLLMATYEMSTYGKEYQKQVIANAKAFAHALKDVGLQVEGDPKLNYTSTHQVVLRVGYAKGMEIAQRLEKNNIIVNYQALPDDEGFTASSGLRTGVQEMTRFGMKEKDFGRLAELMAAVILHGKDVSQEVSRFREGFLKMQYCLPENEAAPLIDELIANLIKD